MINLNNVDLERIANATSLQKLSEFQDFEVELSFKIAMFVPKFMEIVRVYLAEKKKLFEKYADQENGKPKIVNGQYLFTRDTDKLQAEFDKLLALNVEIDADKIEIKHSELLKGVLSPSDIINLQPIIEFKES
jgi:hypothetical protein